jgi:23S rRNA (uracil1939-C5)-methyltransferase
VNEFELDITGLSHDGRGVGRHEGKVVFATGALPGERVRVRRSGRNRNFDEADTVAVLLAAPDRVEPRCAHFGVCAGCVLQHLAPEAQIAAKQSTLLDNLARIAALVPARVLTPLTADPWAYRRRGRLSVRWVEKKGRALVGFRENNGRYVADVASCPVLHPMIGTRIAELAALIGSLDAKREIAQIEFAAGDDTAAVVLRNLVPASDGDRARLVDFARKSGLAVMLQPGGIDSVQALYPEAPRLAFRFVRHAIEIEFRALDFIQVNGAINVAMVERALDLLAPRPGDRVLDLFCGLGNFTLPLARRVTQVTGVEGDAGLLARARSNARANAIDNVDYVAADLAQDQRDAPWARADYELMLLDPPRAGAEAVLDYLPGRSVRRIVYVSCHPASLARDAAILVARHGFRLEAAGVMDMFPHTAHVESIALFER